MSSCHNTMTFCHTPPLSSENPKRSNEIPNSHHTEFFSKSQYQVHPRRTYHFFLYLYTKQVIFKIEFTYLFEPNPNLNDLGKI